MSNLLPTIRQGFSYYFNDFLQRVTNLANDLSDEELWRNPYPYGNSIGNLVLHITGNLSYYIGAQLASTTYVRDRAAEFSQGDQPAKAALLQQLKAVIELVTITLAAQTEDEWSAPYRAIDVDDVPDRFSIFLRCAVHFHHHIGHMSYTRDELLRQRPASTQ